MPAVPFIHEIIIASGRGFRKVTKRFIKARFVPLPMGINEKGNWMRVKELNDVMRKLLMPH